ncbi:DinB family protein [Saccharibacillus kuerlensis]|uniref:DinB-like domain-containing protein n=1 Tax=Saccharibacillus kuerlensis TaxID=459527 RepID=A0ABQ2L4R8_9BACL|nr:DinB family protein [Saccharibacillus kuerlensis]GGO02812.1 hypothetical protein GCM10010969_26460 [Saccharibacillus kuerlensis]
MSNSNREKLLDDFGQWIGEVREMESKGEAFWDRPLGEGKWTIREMVAHIVEWDCYFYEYAVKKTTVGDTPAIKPMDDEEFNAKAAAVGKMMSAGELTARAFSVRTALLEAIGNMSEERYLQVFTQPNGQKFQAEQYLQDFIWHDRHHLTQVKELERLTTPTS